MPLLERYAADPPFVLPQTRLNEVRSHVEGGLQDVSITRESVNWGVPLPWDPSQAIYVWIDALINYTSALTYARPGEDLTARLWPARWQLLGKDILRFHAVIWPAMLLSAGYELPRQLFIHGMLAGQDGHRMSKTRGNAMDYRPAVAAYGARRAALLPAARGRASGRTAASATRACTTATTASSPTSSATSSRAASRWSTRYRDGVIPTVAPAPELAALAAEVADAYEQRFEHLDFTGALERVWELVRALNRFVEARAPWELAKSDEPGGRRRARRDARDAERGRARPRRAAVAVPARPRRRSCWPPSARRPTTWASTARCSANGSGRSVDASGGSLFPRVDAPRGVIDTHAHLQGLRGRPRGGDRGGGRGRRRAHRLRRRLAGARRGGDRPRARPRRRLRHGRAAPAPRRAVGRRAARAARCAARRPGGRGGGGVRPRLLPRPRLARGPGGGVRRPGRARRAARQAARDPHARGGRRHARRAARDELRRRPALLLAARAPRRGGRARLVRVVRGQRDLPVGGAAGRRGRGACPAELLLLETDCPYLSPRAAPRQAEPPPLRARDAERRRRHARRRARAELAAQVEANAARVFALP